MERGVVDRLTIIIEVKGCWGGKVLQEMESQLVDRYTKVNGVAYGLYIVGYYMCAEWHDTDPRKARTPNKTMLEFRDYIENQAKEIKEKKSFVENVRAFVLDLSI